MPPPSSPRIPIGSNLGQSSSSIPLKSANHESPSVHVDRLTNGVHPSSSPIGLSPFHSQTVANSPVSYRSPNRTPNKATEEKSIGETAYVEMKPSLIDISQSASPASTLNTNNDLEFSNKSFKHSPSSQLNTEIMPIIEPSKPRKLHIPEVFNH